MKPGSGSQRGGPVPEIRLAVTHRDQSLHYSAVIAEGLREFSPVPLLRPLEAYFTDFFQAVEDHGGFLVLSPDKTRADRFFDERGLVLLEQVFPKDLQTFLWERRRHCASLQIVTDIPWIPWELCKLQGSRGGRPVEDGFLCEVFDMTRWQPGCESSPFLPLDSPALVAPCGRGLPRTDEEVGALSELASDEREWHRIPARMADLAPALEAGVNDGWHFAGHAGMENGVNGPTAVFELERGDTFSPDQVTGKAKNMGRTRPLVFLNGCHTGRAGNALSEPGGWARRFIACGAGAFLGTLWNVENEAAAAFSREFYTRLFAGERLGSAARNSRLSIRQNSPGSWLAYTVYGDPMARVPRAEDFLPTWERGERRGGASWQDGEKPLLFTLGLLERPVSLQALAELSGVVDSRRVERTLQRWAPLIAYEDRGESDRVWIRNVAFRAFLRGFGRESKGASTLQSAQARIVKVLESALTGP